MRIAHLADLHLGLRQYGVERRGMNLREQDLLMAFDRAVDLIIAQKPDMVVIAGDMFDSPLIPRLSIRRVIQITKRLATALQNNTVIVAIGGNHDTPKTPNDRAHVLLLLREAVPTLHVHVFQPNVYTFYLGDKKICVGAIPSSYSPSAYLQKPDAPIVVPKPGADYNILIVHGLHDVAAAMMHHLDTMWYIHSGHYNPNEWNYVAWGHYHDYTVISDREIYCGSPENTSFATSDTPRGYVLADLNGTSLHHTLVPIPGRKHLLYDIEDESQLEALAANEEAISEAIVKLRIRYTTHTRDKAYDLSRLADKTLRSKCAVLLIQRVRNSLAEDPLDADGFANNNKCLEERWAEFVRSQLASSELLAGVTIDDIIERGLQALAQGGREQ